MSHNISRIRGNLTHLLLGLMLCLFLISGTVQAQSGNSLEFTKVLVTLQPEFTQPAILISYSVSLPANAPLPDEVVLNLPEDVHQLESLTGLIPEHQFDPVEYEIVFQNDSAELRFKPNSRDFVITFIDVNLVKDGTNRFYAFHWRSPYNVNDFQIRVIRPAGASEIETHPELGFNSIGSDGVEYYEENFDGVEAGEDFFLELSYIKELGDLNNPALIVVSGDPLDDQTAGQTPKPNSLMLALLSIASTGVLGLLIFFSLRLAAVQKKKVSNSVLPVNGQHSSLSCYCLDCGQLLEKGDRFCKSCGAVQR